jgi:hypothetical protein
MLRDYQQRFRNSDEKSPNTEGCEHEVWIDTIQLELGTTNAIFICVPEIKQLAMKLESEYGFVTRSRWLD